jgi:hypothetical protein
MFELALLRKMLLDLPPADAQQQSLWVEENVFSLLDIHVLNVIIEHSIWN